MILLISIFIFIFSNLYSNNINNIFYSNLIFIAESSIGLTNFPNIKNKTFSSDCIGFIKYIYYKAGLDIDVAIQKNIKGGVDSLYFGLLKRKFIYTNYPPILCSLIFFDNTFDSNKNGKWDDYLTHIGVVTKILDFNTIVFIHYSGGKVCEGRINLNYPKSHAIKLNNKKFFILNTFLRKYNKNQNIPKYKYLSSNFFNSFAYIKIKKKSN